MKKKKQSRGIFVEVLIPVRRRPPWPTHPKTFVTKIDTTPAQTEVIDTYITPTEAETDDDQEQQSPLTHHTKMKEKATLKDLAIITQIEKEEPEEIPFARSITPPASLDSEEHVWKPSPYDEIWTQIKIPCYKERPLPYTGIKSWKPNARTEIAFSLMPTIRVQASAISVS